MEKHKLKNFVDSGLSTYQIADRVDKGQTTVRYWLKKYGLQTIYPQYRISGSAEEFWNWVDISEPDNCWQWKEARKGEYGKYRLDGRRMGAHRVAWELTNGPVPAGMEVCHRCDNPCCVNPAHLFVGTHQDNMMDAYIKGRIAPPPAFIKLGVENHSAKLTETDVKNIRARYSSGETQTSIAQDFPVSNQQISEIVRRKCWSHI